MSKLPVAPDASGLIIHIRGQAVILDADLAMLYGVETRQLNQQMKRNVERFPTSFAFQLTKTEWERLRSQNVISKGRGGRRYAPYVFTEHGVLMAANVLNSNKAIKTSVAIVEAFVKLRRMALSVEGMARKLNALESKYDQQFKTVFNAVRQLMALPPSKKIDGFKNNKD